MSDSSKKQSGKSKREPYTFPSPVSIKMGTNGDGIVVTEPGGFSRKIGLDKFSEITIIWPSSVRFTIEEREPRQHKPLILMPKPDLYRKGYEIIGKTEAQKTIQVYYKRESDSSFYFESISERGDDRRFLGSLKNPNSKLGKALSLIDINFPRQPFSLADARAVMRSYKGLRHNLTSRALIEVLTIEGFLQKLEEKNKRGSDLYIRNGKHQVQNKKSRSLLLPPKEINH
jgi:hypothetical protein